MKSINVSNSVASKDKFLSVTSFLVFFLVVVLAVLTSVPSYIVGAVALISIMTNAMVVGLENPNWNELSFNVFIRHGAAFRAMLSAIICWFIH